FCMYMCYFFFFFQAEDGIRDKLVTGVQTCALPIYLLFLPADHLGQERRSLQLHQPCPDHEERGQALRRRRVAIDGPQVVLGQAGQRDRLEVDLRPLRQRQEELDRTVERRRGHEVDGVTLDLDARPRGVRAFGSQLRSSASCRRTVRGCAGRRAWCSLTISASSAAPNWRRCCAPTAAWSR